MYRVVLLPLAAKDIQEAAKWYSKKKNGLGNEFLFEVRKASRFIQKHPEAIAIRYDATRTVLLDRFPFLIHFTIDTSKKVILISAVLHTSRNPKKWRRKG